MRRLPLPAALLLALALPGLARATDLVVEITNIRPNEGLVLVQLAANAAEFPTQVADPARRRREGATGQTLRLVFPGLAPGRYAVSAIQDENGNGVLDRNALGIPAEAYGFSRDVGRFGQPGFDDAAVEVGGAEQHIRFRLR